MYCMSCGTKLPDDVKFCPKCGTAVSQVSSTVQGETEPLSGEDKTTSETRGTAGGCYGDASEESTGAHAFESNEATGQEDYAEQVSDENEEREKYEPPIDADDLHTLDRNGTILALNETERIALHVENFTNRINADLLPNIQDIRNRINAEMKKAEEVRNELSTEGKKTRRIALLIIVIVGVIVGIIADRLVGAIVVGGLSAIFGFIIVTIVLSVTDPKKHGDENNARAEAYIREHIPRLERELQSRTAELEQVRKELTDYIESGAVDWAEMVVGVDLFYSSAIAELRRLVESHRADNLKEALLQYDEMQHKARMEEMQAATKAAAESTAASAAATAAATAVAAAEAVKQTELERKIAKNTRRTATAAAFTAVSAHNTSRHTKDLGNH